MNDLLRCLFLLVAPIFIYCNRAEAQSSLAINSGLSWLYFDSPEDIAGDAKGINLNLIYTLKSKTSDIAFESEFSYNVLDGKPFVGETDPSMTYPYIENNSKDFKSTSLNSFFLNNSLLLFAKSAPVFFKIGLSVFLSSNFDYSFTKEVTSYDLYKSPPLKVYSTHPVTSQSSQESGIGFLTGLGFHQSIHKKFGISGEASVIYSKFSFNRYRTIDGHFHKNYFTTKYVFVNIGIGLFYTFN